MAASYAQKSRGFIPQNSLAWFIQELPGSGMPHAYLAGFGGTRMWVQIGAAAGALVLVMALFKRLSRPKSKEIDVGAVSDAWLAEHRARGRDSV